MKHYVFAPYPIEAVEQLETWLEIMQQQGWQLTRFGLFASFIPTNATYASYWITQQNDVSTDWQKVCRYHDMIIYRNQKAEMPKPERTTPTLFKNMIEKIGISLLRSLIFILPMFLYHYSLFYLLCLLGIFPVIAVLLFLLEAPSQVLLCRFFADRAYVISVWKLFKNIWHTFLILFICYLAFFVYSPDPLDHHTEAWPFPTLETLYPNAEITPATISIQNDYNTYWENHTFLTPHYIHYSQLADISLEDTTFRQAIVVDYYRMHNPSLAQKMIKTILQHLTDQNDTLTISAITNGWMIDLPYASILLLSQDEEVLEFHMVGTTENTDWQDIISQSFTNPHHLKAA